jgi:hypothetical protein
MGSNEISHANVWDIPYGISMGYPIGNYGIGWDPMRSNGIDKLEQV